MIASRRDTARRRRPMPTSRALAAAALLAASSPLAAFHDEGVANCDGCHVSHTDAGGAAVQEGLLLAESPSDVCLMCHENDWGRVLGADPMSPPTEIGAGNFVFLLEDNLNDGIDGATDPIPGHAAGHNVVAPGHGLGADPRYLTAPGGSFPTASLGCTSCHDPHGTSGFRLLHGRGEVQGGIATFSFEAPEGQGLHLRTGAEGPGSHSAYRGGISAWCGNCHETYHEHGSSPFDHEAERALGASISQRYNEYDGEDDPAGGSQPTAYLPAVPFESATATTTSTEGPAPSARLMCLSCHRAHASSAPAAGRWDFNVSLLSEDGLVSGSYAIPSPYPDPAQGSLCAKCHDASVLSGAGTSLPLEPSPFGQPPSWPTDPDGDGG